MRLILLLCFLITPQLKANDSKMSADKIIDTAEQYLKAGDYNKAIKFLNDNKPPSYSSDIENLKTKAHKMKIDNIIVTAEQYLKDGDYNKAIKFLRDNRPRFESFDICIYS